MPVPNRYQNIGEGSISSYDYFDIADGTGIISLYAASTSDNGTLSYIMLTQTQYSDTVLTAGSVGNVGETKILDIDFDLVLNTPRNLKGKFVSQVAWIQGHETTANVGGTSYCIVKLRKWDGTSETEIASNTKSKVLSTASLEISSETAYVQISVPTTIHFKKGETLRITVEVWSLTTQTNGTQVALLHDPKNRSMTSGSQYDYNGGAVAITDPPETTQTIFNVPWKLDL